MRCESPMGGDVTGKGRCSKASKKPQISLWRFRWWTWVEEEEEEEGFYWQKTDKGEFKCHFISCILLSHLEASLDAHVTAPALWLPGNPADKTTRNGLENCSAVTTEWEFRPNAVSRAAAMKLKSSSPPSPALKSSLCPRPALRSTILTWRPFPALLGEGPVAHLMLHVFFFPSFSFASFPAV